MKLERTLFQKSYLYFIGFFVFVLFAFWLTYFTRIFDQENYRLHTHGITLILWCLMLIVQPYLIRSKKTGLHKRIGTLSYVLVPLLVFTTVDLLHFRLRDLPSLGTMDFFFVALVLNALIAFLIFYGLAIFSSEKFRDSRSLHDMHRLPDVHAGYRPNHSYLLKAARSLSSYNRRTSHCTRCRISIGRSYPCRT